MPYTGNGADSAPALDSTGVAVTNILRNARAILVPNIFVWSRDPRRVAHRQVYPKSFPSTSLDFQDLSKRRNSTKVAHMAATLRYNADRSCFEVLTPEGDEFGPIEFPEDCISVLEGDAGPSYLVIHAGYDGLEPDTLYRLVPVVTEIQEPVELSVEDEEIEPEDGLATTT
jgi:hypothetical protein